MRCADIPTQGLFVLVIMPALAPGPRSALSQLSQCALAVRQHRHLRIAAEVRTRSGHCSKREHVQDLFASGHKHSLDRDTRLPHTFASHTWILRTCTGYSCLIVSYRVPSVMYINWGYKRKEFRNETIITGKRANADERSPRLCTAGIVDLLPARVCMSAMSYAS